MGYELMDRGAGELVVMLHGLGSDHTGLRPVAENLAGVDIVLPDLPGYGGSEPLDEEHSLLNYAHFVERLRLELGRRTSIWWAIRSGR